METSTDNVQPEKKDTVAFVFAGATDEDLERIIGRIRQELVLLRNEQNAISKRIALLKTTVIGLAQVFGSEVIHEELRTLLSLPLHRRSRSHPGLTELCRKSLMEASHPLTLPEILQQIREKHPVALANHKNPRVSLNVVLNRLVDYSEAEGVTSAGGLRAWKWASPLQFAATHQGAEPSQ